MSEPDVEVLGSPDDLAELEVRRLVTLALAAGGVHDGHVAVEFVDEARIHELNREHRGRDAPTDVLSFPIDGRDELPAGLPRQLGDAVLCPQVVGAGWRDPLVHGLLHLVGYDHGPEMEAREAVHRG